MVSPRQRENMQERGAHGSIAGAIGAGREAVGSLPKGQESEGLLRLCVPAGNFFPIDHIEECGDIVGPAILVLQVVRMLPHV